VIRLGTRGSDLALRQSSLVTERLRAAGETVEVEIIHTRGDATDRPFREIEGKAFFTRELDEALIERRIDLAIHSLKDLPTEDPEGLVTLCVLPRADSRDLLLVGRDTTVLRDAGGVALPRGIRIGTSSARRFAQLQHAFPGVKVVDLRGNVPTRVARLRRGEFDAIVIAAAGIERLGLELKDLTVVPLDPPLFLPAPGQGVLAARARAADAALVDRLRSLVDPDAADCARAERRLLERLEGGCSLPLGALARRGETGFVLEACLAHDGRMRRARAEAADPDEAAALVAESLVGGAAMPTIVVTRPDGLDHELAQAIEKNGLAVVTQPAIRFVPRPIDDRMRSILRALDAFDVVAFTSRQAVRSFIEVLKRAHVPGARLKSIAALGPATRGELERHGLRVEITGDGTGALAFAESIVRKNAAATHVLHPGPAEPDPEFARRLARARMRVTPLPLYETLPVQDDPALPPGPIVAIVASPSAARAFLGRASVRARLAENPCRIHLVAGGATTAAELERLRHPAAACAGSPSIDALLPALGDVLEVLARSAPFAGRPAVEVKP